MRYLNLQREYTKQQAQTVHDYRGYQTMDSRVHPDVVRGQKASDLISDVSLKLFHRVDFLKLEIQATAVLFNS